MYLSAKSFNHALRATQSKLFHSLASASKNAQILLVQSERSFFIVNKSKNYNKIVNVTARHFALPSHMKLGLPNLSPTMEKVLNYQLMCIG
jgi:hypothetical protein